MTLTYIAPWNLPYSQLTPSLQKALALLQGWAGWASWARPPEAAAHLCSSRNKALAKSNGLITLCSPKPMILVFTLTWFVFASSFASTLFTSLGSCCSPLDCDLAAVLNTCKFWEIPFWSFCNPIRIYYMQSYKQSYTYQLNAISYAILYASQVHAILYEILCLYLVNYIQSYM